MKKYPQHEGIQACGFRSLGGLCNNCNPALRQLEDCEADFWDITANSLCNLKNTPVILTSCSVALDAICAKDADFRRSASEQRIPSMVMINLQEVKRIDPDGLAIIWSCGVALTLEEHNSVVQFRQERFTQKLVEDLRKYPSILDIQINCCRNIISCGGIDEDSRNELLNKNIVEYLVLALSSA